jgi:hypothetical protein
MRRLSQLAPAVALLFAFTVLVGADPIDPVFTMSDPDSGIPIFSPSFSYYSNANGGGFVSFVNQSQFDWKGLAVQIIQPTGTIISCSGGPYFPTCLISSIPQTGGLSLFTLNFTLRTKEGGLPNGEFFTINLNDFIGEIQPADPNGKGGWGAYTSFNARATDLAYASPEPSTFFLLALALLLAFMAHRFSERRS